MRPVIQQSVILPASAEDLFELFIDPVLHAEFTGAPVRIDGEIGAAFEAFSGSLSGTMLAVSAPRLIVMSWRSSNFHADDPDSTLVLTFTRVGTPPGSEGRIDLVHLDVPAHDFTGVSDGWNTYYWEPLREYLRGR